MRLTLANDLTETINETRNFRDVDIVDIEKLTIEKYELIVSCNIIIHITIYFINLNTYMCLNHKSFGSEAVCHRVYGERE